MATGQGSNRSEVHLAPNPTPSSGPRKRPTLASLAPDPRPWPESTGWAKLKGKSRVAKSVNKVTHSSPLNAHSPNRHLMALRNPTFNTRGIGKMSRWQILGKTFLPLPWNTLCERIAIGWDIQLGLGLGTQG